MATARINLTVDENAKEEALKLFERFGMDASTAVNIFFKKVVQTKSIPFEISAVDTNYKTTYDMSKEEFMGRVQSAIDNRTVWNLNNRRLKNG